MRQTFNNRATVPGPSLRLSSVERVLSILVFSRTKMSLDVKRVTGCQIAFQYNNLLHSHN